LRSYRSCPAPCAGGSPENCRPRPCSSAKGCAHRFSGARAVLQPSKRVGLRRHDSACGDQLQRLRCARLTADNRALTAHWQSPASLTACGRNATPRRGVSSGTVDAVSCGTWCHTPAPTCEIAMPERLTLPVLPLRDMVLFPGVTAPIGAGRPATLRDIEAALKHPSRRVFAAAQR